MRISMRLVAGAVLALVLAVPAGAGAGGGGPMVRVLIRGAGSSQAALRAQHGVRHDFGPAGFTTEVPEAAFRALAARSDLRVERVPERQVYDSATGRGNRGGRGGKGGRPVPADRTPWGIETIYNNAATASTGGGSGIVVAVLDTGVSSHPDLAAPGRCVDFSQNRSPVVEGSCLDRNGHGTHVAGTIAANGGSDGLGIFGVAPEAEYWALKVCGNNGRCWADDIARAIDYAAENGAHIISISLGGAEPGTLEHEAIQRAAARGVLVIAAAGNEGPGPGTIAYPAAFPEVIAVGALERVDPASADRSPANLQVSFFSGRGLDDGDDSVISERELEVAAPGRDVESTWNDGGYRILSGTSMAAPHISGLAAAYWSAHPRLSADEVREWLRGQARAYDITRAPEGGAGPGYDTASGYGSARFD